MAKFKDDQNMRELRQANQKDGSARTPHSENELSEEESAAIEAKKKASKKLAEVPPEKQHTRIP